MPGTPRIGPKRPRRIYLAEHRERLSLTQKQLGERLNVSDMTVSRWETGKALLSTDVLAAVAEALGKEPQDLYYHPDHPSADILLREQPADVQALVLRTISRKAS